MADIRDPDAPGRLQFACLAARKEVGRQRSDGHKGSATGKVARWALTAQMRGFDTEEQLFRETIDWRLNVDPEFDKKWVE